MTRNSKTVSASDIGACGYCAYKLYLQKNQGISNQTAQRFIQGNRAHAHYNRQFRSGTFVRAILLLMLLLLLYGLWA